MGFKKVLIGFFKNSLSILIGTLLGAVISVFYGLNFWLPIQIDSLPNGFFQILFGSLGLIIVTIILFGLLGAVIGGILGLIIYNLQKMIRKK